MRPLNLLTRIFAHHTGVSTVDEPSVPNNSAHPNAHTSAWKCHSCNRDNTLTLVSSHGAHPLGTLRCSACKHIFCPSCPPPKFLQPWSSTGTEMWSNTNATPCGIQHIPVVHVCSKCGLSWRAQVGKIKRFGMAGKQYAYARMEKAKWGPVARCDCGEEAREWCGFGECRWGAWVIRSG